MRTAREIILTGFGKLFLSLLGLTEKINKKQKDRERYSALHKIKRGDILVTVVTHPDYLPTMRRAKAIITDEGGLTSHAAIVSRELGIPCIVGTEKELLKS